MHACTWASLDHGPLRPTKVVEAFNYKTEAHSLAMLANRVSKCKGSMGFVSSLFERAHGIIQVLSDPALTLGRFVSMMMVCNAKKEKKKAYLCCIHMHRHAVTINCYF